MILTWNLGWEHPEAQQLVALAKRAADATAEEMGLPQNCEVAVWLTDDAHMQALNLDMRGIDAPTDVLSFPRVRWAVPFEKGKPFKVARDADSGYVFLGDMAISGDRVQQQAAEFLHGFAREGSYLVVHSLLHLLGYDHMNDQEKAKMRVLEEQIMEKVALEP